MAIHSIAELVSAAQMTGKPLWQIIRDDDLLEGKYDAKESTAQMRHLWETMCSASEHYNPTLVSKSGLSGKDGAKMQRAVEAGATIVGDFLGQVMTEALKMGENNACMRRIVAAPTAGSCGVLPAVLIPYFRCYHPTEEQIVEALYVAAGFGEVLALRASISGAEGGCQAEIGSASAMAAAALTALRGGTPEMMATACALALKSVLGLVCDPVAGLVEVPCVKRNVMGAVNAITASEMAMAGIESKIPVDEVIDTMGAVGRQLPACLRETGEGGLAASPTGRAQAKAFFEQESKANGHTSEQG